MGLVREREQKVGELKRVMEKRKEKAQSRQRGRIKHLLRNYMQEGI